MKRTKLPTTAMGFSAPFSNWTARCTAAQRDEELEGGESKHNGIGTATTDGDDDGDEVVVVVVELVTVVDDDDGGGVSEKKERSRVARVVGV